MLRSPGPVPGPGAPWGQRQQYAGQRNLPAAATPPRKRHPTAGTPFPPPGIHRCAPRQPTFAHFWLGAQPVIPNWGVGWPSQPGPASPRNQNQCISVSRQDSNAPVRCSWGCTGFEMIVVFGNQVYPASRTFWASNPGFSRAPCYRVGCHWHHKIGLGLLHRWV